MAKCVFVCSNVATMTMTYDDIYAAPAFEGAEPQRATDPVCRPCGEAFVRIGHKVTLTSIRKGD